MELGGQVVLQGLADGGHVEGVAEPVAVKDEVAAAVTAIDGVELSEVTAGPFDVIAKVQATNLDALGKLIVSRVQAVPGTLRTLTCPRPGPDRPDA